MMTIAECTSIEILISNLLVQIEKRAVLERILNVFVVDERKTTIPSIFFRCHKIQ